MESEPEPRVRMAVLLRIVLPVALLALTGSVLWLLPDFIKTLPRTQRTRVIEGFLRAVLIGYFSLVGVGLIGTPLFGALAWRAWRRRRPQPWLARLALFCWGALIALIGAELGSVVWSAWAHRMPALPTRFVEPSTANERHIVVLGESSAAGDPFHQWFSIGKLVAWQMGEANPATNYVADVLAERGVTLERMHLKLESLRHRPDAIIVFCGHNEFQARFDWGRSVGAAEEPSSPVLRFLYGVSRRSPLCRFIDELITKTRLDAPPNIGKHQLIDPPMCSPTEVDAIRDDFARRLDAIAAYGNRIGALMFFVIPPGNEGGWEPNRSSLRPWATEADRVALAQRFEQARATEHTEPDASLAAYYAIVEDYPEFAEGQFRLARMLHRRGDFNEASRYYQLARDNDTFPQRCTTAFQQVYRDVAARRGCILIDGPAVMRALNPRGLLDDSLFLDAQHPALAGHVALAQAVLHEIATHAILGWPSGTPSPTLDPAACAGHFGMTRSDWTVVCDSASWFAGVTSYNRFDRTERLAKQRRLHAAAVAINAGAAPEEAGVPGLGPHPQFDADPEWALASDP